MTFSGLLFRGWALDSGAASPEYLAGQAFTFAEPVTLHAIWQTVTAHTVTYVLAGGTKITDSVHTGETPSKIPDVPDTTRTFIGWKDKAGHMVAPADVVIYKNETFTAYYAVKLNTTDHTKYMSGYDNGLFKPEDPLTRAEACEMLYNLVTETDEITISFPDVSQNIWYYEAVSTMASMGLLQGDEAGNFRPESNITRAEFVEILSRFYPIEAGELKFNDISSEYWAAKAVCSAQAKGWIIGGGDGLFRPEDAVTRAEAAVIMNRVLQRTANKEVIDAAADIRIFPDLPKDYWAYYDIMEATVDHQYNKDSSEEVWTSFAEEKANIQPGFHFIDGQLYYEDESGYFIHNSTYGTFTFDRLGRSTTGNVELDAYITDAVLKVTNPSMTRMEMLRAVYDYTRDNFTYLVRNYYKTGDTGWEVKEGLVMFQTGKGNCYCFASVFCLLSRRLGFDSVAVSGGVGSHNSPHGWVEIVIDDQKYVFDPGLEMSYSRNGPSPYNLFSFSYGNEPWPYVK
jgi:hypothetical protein